MTRFNVVSASRRWIAGYGVWIGCAAAVLVAGTATAQEAGSVDLMNMRGTWTKVCGAPKGRPTCFTTADFGRNRSNTLALAVYDTKGKPPLLRAMVPLGTLENHGIRVSAGGRLVAVLKFALCTSTACFAEARISDAEPRTFVDGGDLQLTVEDRLGKHTTFNLPLAGFQNAFKGEGISEEQAHHSGTAP